MTTRYYSFAVESFMLCSICLYVVMPKLLPRISSKKTANMIFLVFWSVMTIVGVGLATHVLFY